MCNVTVVVSLAEEQQERTVPLGTFYSQHGPAHLVSHFQDLGAEHVWDGNSALLCEPNGGGGEGNAQGRSATGEVKCTPQGRFTRRGLISLLQSVERSLDGDKDGSGIVYVSVGGGRFVALAGDGAGSAEKTLGNSRKYAEAAAGLVIERRRRE